MALRQDLVVIQRNANKAINLIDLKDSVTTVSIDPTRDFDGELQVTLTAAQKQQLQNAFAACIALIKSTAAGLP